MNIQANISEVGSISPDVIMQIGTGFWASKVLLSAVELGVFTTLAQSPLKAGDIGSRHQLHPRSLADFLDVLVALGMLEKTMDVYSNAPAADLFLDRNKPTYVGGFLEMCNARLYRFWADLTEALRTGEPQNEAKTVGDLFEALYQSPADLQRFLAAMTGLSLGTGQAIARKFPWADYKTFVDVGCAEGAVPVAIAAVHPHLTGVGLDLPPVKNHFDTYVSRHGLGDRLTFAGGDFLTDPVPRADVVLMGHILHDWGLEKKQELIRKAYDALPAGGALLIFELLIDDERRMNTFGLLASLNMLIETREGFDYTGAQAAKWLHAAGFREVRVEHLAGPDWMVVAIK